MIREFNSTRSVYLTKPIQNNVFNILLMTLYNIFQNDKVPVHLKKTHEFSHRETRGQKITTDKKDTTNKLMNRLKY